MDLWKTQNTKTKCVKQKTSCRFWEINIREQEWLWDGKLEIDLWVEKEGQDYTQNDDIYSGWGFLCLLGPFFLFISALIKLNWRKIISRSDLNPEIYNNTNETFLLWL